MRAKQSFTASGMQSSFGLITPYLTNHVAASRVRLRGQSGGRAGVSRRSRDREVRKLQDSTTTSRGEGLLHDARNLVGTIGLYCDLLSMPGVLKPEHRQYPEELRLLGARSKSLIDHLMQSVFVLEDAAAAPVCNTVASDSDRQAGGGIKRHESGRSRGDAVKQVSLRSIVERCSGLLGRVANGRLVEITYGPAAGVLVRVPDEVVERILVNLVRNAATAMGPSDGSAFQGPKDAAAVIRILVGPLVSSVGEHKPWPFQRVRLVVEDAGKGMNAQQLERLLGGTGARSQGHGIGFGVVRDLVAASEGELRVMSEPEIGTRVQIEWPIAAMPEAGNGTDKIPDAKLESPSKGLQTSAKSDAAKSGLLENFKMDMSMGVAY